MIRRATSSDAVAIAEIYNHYIQHTVVTFEEIPVTIEEMTRRIEAVNATHEWVVYEVDHWIIGYAYASKWNVRSAYRYSAELTVYLDPNQKRKGIGTALYQYLIETFEARGVKTFICGITLPNAASVALHEKFGFQKAAHYKSVGFKQERWLDVGYWQRIKD